MASSCNNPVPASCLPTGVTDPRLLDNFTRRFNTATSEALIPSEPHPVNGDLTLADKCGSYSKGIKQAGPGKVDLAAFALFQTAISTGTFSGFEAVPKGGTAKQNGPMGSYARVFCGADSSAFGAPSVPAPPSVDKTQVSGKQYATELVELYWCSLLRDVAFTDYANHPVAQNAANELSSAPQYQGPTAGGQVTPELLFRGNFKGETVGPYVSQLLLTPTNLGAAPYDQRYITYRAGIDYMTDQQSWFLVQNGGATGLTNQPESVPRYLHDGRGFAAWTHVDELYQAYFTAYLVLESLGVPANPTGPYKTANVQKPFGTFGGPDIAAVLAEVAKCALNAVWYQKWVVHLRHRPEAGAGLVHLIKGGDSFSATPDPFVFDSDALQASFSKYGSYLLSQPFPEGSPTHPAYPTGHGTVAGACITILKFFYDADHYVFGHPVMPSYDGTALLPWSGQPGTGAAGPLTLYGELHKLAHNISFGHGIHGGIHWRSDTDSSIMLGEEVALRYLKDLACTYKEHISVKFTKIDGTHVTISN
jgi:hypothetical protein